MEKKFISIKEAAEILGVSKLTLRNWDRDGKLFAMRHPINNYRVFHIDDIKRIINKIHSGEKPNRTYHKSKKKFHKVKVISIQD